MMHKAWCNLEEVPYNFSRSSIKFQGHTGRKIEDLNPIWVRILGRSQLTNPSDLPCWGSSVKFLGHTVQKIFDFDPNWAFPDCYWKKEITNGYEMMHKAWSSLEEVPYCFARSSVKFQGCTALKSSNLTQIRPFRTVTPVWIHQWVWNAAQSLKLHRRGALLFFMFIHQITRSQGSKNHQILTQIERFQYVTPIWIHQWVRNDTQSLKWHRRDALLFSRVICKISRSHG